MLAAPFACQAAVTSHKLGMMASCDESEVAATDPADPSTEEMARAMRFAAAKFARIDPEAHFDPGLLVALNNGPVESNNHRGRPLKIGDNEFVRGLACHADSKVVVRLPGPGKKFASRVGLDDNEQTHTGQGSVTFAARIDGRRVFQSGVFGVSTPAGLAEFPLDGAEQFVLEVGDAGDGIGWDQADWADARVEMVDGSTVWLGDLPIIDVQDGLYSVDPPFSFAYNGKPSSEFLDSWTVDRSARKLDEHRTAYTVVHSDPAAGLSVRCEAVTYDDFPNVEWTLYFKNTGSVDTPIIENIRSLDVRWQRRREHEYLLHHNVGSPADGSDYSPLETVLAGGTKASFAAAGGRSTAATMSYFNLAQRPDEGLIVVVGWPGQWSADFVRDRDLGIRIAAGQELTHFVLHPGEEVRTPLSVLQFWKGGDWIRAQNIWRRWMIAHNMPRPGGNLPAPMLLRSAAYAEMQRIIREVEPAKPSTRLSNNTETIANVAARRRTEPARLGKLMRGDLDWIVMKALEKDRQRRYATANALAMDVQRHLGGEAITAAPPSASYRLRKFARRHRAGVALGLAVSVAVLLGLIGTSVGLAWAVRERDRADKAASDAIEAKGEAQKRSRDLERVVSFQSAQLSGVDVMQMGIRFRRDLLAGIRRAGETTHAPAASVDANVGAVDTALAGVDLTDVARSALENGVLRPSIDAIRVQFADQPSVRADLLSTVSESSRRLGLFELADQPGREAIEGHTGVEGASGVKTLDARMRRAMLAKDRGKLTEAEAELRECLSLAQKEHGEDAKITVDLRANLATALTARMQFQEATELYQRALPWYRAHEGPLDADTLGCMASLASAFGNLKRFDEAGPLFREAVEGVRSAFGTGNQRTIQAMNNLAGFYRAKEDYASAQRMFEEALAAARMALGEDHYLTLMIVDNLGGVRFAQKDPKGAAEHARAALDGRRRVLGEGHAATLRSCFNLGKVLESLGELDEAISLYRRAAAGFRIVYGEFHQHTTAARTALAGALLNAKRFGECESVLAEEVAILDVGAEASKDRRLAVIGAMGSLYEKWDIAEPGQGYGAKAAEWNAKLDSARVDSKPASAGPENK